VHRIVPDQLGEAGFDDLAAAHDQCAVGDHAHDGEVVRDKQQPGT
jgi:hypothetical protein